MSGRCGKLNSNEITRWAGFRKLTGEHMEITRQPCAQNRPE